MMVMPQKLGLKKGFLEDFDRTADELFEALCETFPSVCHTRLRVIDDIEREGMVGQGDYTATANIHDDDGSILMSVSVGRDTYLKLIRNVFPAEVATEINQDTRDLLISVLRRALYLAKGFIHKVDVEPRTVGLSLVEGNNHAVFVPSNVKTKVVVCECEQGTVYLQFSRFGRSGLEVVI